MGLISGAFENLKGVARIATAPARTVLSLAGEGLATSGRVLSELSESDLKGAASSLRQRHPQSDRPPSRSARRVCRRSQADG